MTATAQASLRQQIVALPKVELHRHLEGAVRLNTLIEIAREYKIELPTYDPDGLRNYVQITADSPMDSTHFLSKFELLRRFYYSPEVIQRVAHEAVEDAAADNIKYMELRFTPKALSKLMSFPFDQVVEWVCQAVNAAQRTCNIKVRLIVSMNRHESVKEGERALQAALAHRDAGVVALDLAGQEAGYAAAPFFPVFKQAQQAGLGITVHAGEWAGPGNIRDAIVHMGAKRIGHGVRVVEDSTVTQLARERGTVFEVCPTSNIQSGAVSNKQHHPLRDMADLGLKTTINTDDPSVSNITLSDEFLFANQELGLTLDEIKKAILNGAKSAFLPDEERAALVSYFSDALASTPEL